MSIKRKIEWCLKKGKTEKRKHKGLRIIKPSADESKKYMHKAEHNLKFLKKVMGMEEFNDWIFSAAFYAMYHACLAILSHFGYESMNQECTFTVMEQLISEEKISMDMDDLNSIRTIGEKAGGDTKSLREEFQYGTKVKAEHELVEITAGKCENFVKKAEGILALLWGEV